MLCIHVYIFHPNKRVPYHTHQLTSLDQVDMHQSPLDSSAQLLFKHPSDMADVPCPAFFVPAEKVIKALGWWN